MIEDAEIAARFSREQLHASKFSVASDGDGVPLANAIAETLPSVKLSPQRGTEVTQWSDLVLERRELWPIQYPVTGRGLHSLVGPSLSFLEPDAPWLELQRAILDAPVTLAFHKCRERAVARESFLAALTQ